MSLTYNKARIVSPYTQPQFIDMMIFERKTDGMGKNLMHIYAILKKL